MLYGYIVFGIFVMYQRYKIKTHDLTKSLRVTYYYTRTAIRKMNN